MAKLTEKVLTAALAGLVTTPDQSALQKQILEDVVMSRVAGKRVPLIDWIDRALCDACVRGSVAETRWLLAAGANAKEKDSLPLRWAAFHGYLDLVNVLLGAGADPKADASAGLRFAAQHGHLAVVRALIAAGSDPKAGDGAAMKAAQDLPAGSDRDQIIAALEG